MKSSANQSSKCCACLLSLLNGDSLFLQLGPKQQAESVLQAVNQQLGLPADDWPLFQLHYLDQGWVGFRPFFPTLGSGNRCNG